MVKDKKIEGLHYVGKGENINWVKVATSIVKEKAQREEMHILKNGGSMELSKLNGAEEVSHKLPSSILALKFEEPKLTNKCSYGILPTEFTKVGKIHVFLADLLK
jgi:hypothetical protein